MNELYTVLATTNKSIENHVSFAYFDNEKDAESYMQILLDNLNQGQPSFWCKYVAKWFEVEFLTGCQVIGDSEIYGRYFPTLNDALEFLPEELKEIQDYLEGIMVDFLSFQIDNKIEAPDMTLDEIYEIQPSTTCSFYGSQATA